MSLRLQQAFGVVAQVRLASYQQLRFGVPVGGPFDAPSFAIATGLTGAESAWELSMAQATFVAEAAGRVAVIGASAIVRTGATSVGTPCVLSVGTGEVITVGAPTEGARVYVARSAQPLSIGTHRLDLLLPSVEERRVLRVVPGPQSDLFDLGYLGRPFTVSRTSNRVGVRLEESIGTHSVELPSEPQCVGVVQIANDGVPIIIGPDGPTIGGYPKIAVVVSSDIGRVGQLRPGDEVEFEFVDVQTAGRLREEAADWVRRRLAEIRLRTGG